MKDDAIAKAIDLTAGRGMAGEALGSIPDGGAPTDVPPEFLGPPEVELPVGEAAVFDEETGLPLIAQDQSPENFPGQAETGGEADDILQFLF